MSVRALGIALKLTFSGTNQLFYPQTWAFALIVATCVSTQINYLNKVIVLFSAFLLLLDCRPPTSLTISEYMCLTQSKFSL